MRNKTFWILVLGLAALMGRAQENAAEAVSWLDQWQFGGDFRMRFESTDYENDQIKMRNRGRYRLRLEAARQFTQAWGFNVRLASGTGEPTSTNQTFDDSFRGKEIRIDLAYFTYQTSKNWELGAGKFRNPMQTTDIVWDTDVNPEGMYQSYRNNHFYATFMEAVVEEEAVQADTNLLAAQVGFMDKERDRFDIAIGYYSYQNSDNVDYEFAEAVGRFRLESHELKLTYIQNTSNQIDDQDRAWGVFYQFKTGRWASGLKYAEIQPFSVFGLFADSDFGFSDVEGFSAWGSYKVSDFWSWRLTAFSIDSISQPEGGFNRIQLDCNLALGKLARK